MKQKVGRKPYVKRIVKLATACEHKSQKSYALNMCKRCYHSKGRTKLAVGCQHTNRKLYARQVCKACYLKIYRAKQKVPTEEKPSEDN